MSIRTRFAPSPTGFLHIGGLRTALYNYIFSIQNNGDFILRIEDTDQNRIVKNATEQLIKILKKFNLKINEGPNYNDENFGPYLQSKRLHLYKKYYERLLNNGNAYICFEKDNELIPEYNYNKAKDKIDQFKYVVKLKIPNNETLIINDLVRGEVKFDLSLIDDPIIIKSDGFPTYHFANVVDDHLMQISHVIRGEEWLPSLPKHVLLYKYFSWTLPKFVHLPLLLNPDKSKLSKRQGDVHVEDFLKKGYLKDAIINYVALLGWHPSSNDEIFSISTLKKEFSLKRIQKGGAIFDIKKLNWMNSYYIKQLSDKEFKSYAIKFLKIDINNNFEVFCSYYQNRINNFSELVTHYKLYINKPVFNKDNKTILNLESSQKIITYWSENLLSTTKKEIESLTDFCSLNLKIKGKDLFFPLRILLIGQTHGPDLTTIINILGIKETINRLKKQWTN